MRLVESDTCHLYPQELINNFLKMKNKPSDFLDEDEFYFNQVSQSH